MTLSEYTGQDLIDVRRQLDGVQAFKTQLTIDQLCGPFGRPMPTDLGAALENAAARTARLPPSVGLLRLTTGR